MVYAPVTVGYKLSITLSELTYPPYDNFSSCAQPRLMYAAMFERRQPKALTPIYELELVDTSVNSTLAGATYLWLNTLGNETRSAVEEAIERSMSIGAGLTFNVPYSDCSYLIEKGLAQQLNVTTTLDITECTYGNFADNTFLMYAINTCEDDSFTPALVGAYVNATYNEACFSVSQEILIWGAVAIICAICLGLLFMIIGGSCSLGSWAHRRIRIARQANYRKLHAGATMPRGKGDGKEPWNPIAAVNMWFVHVSTAFLYVTKPSGQTRGYTVFTIASSALYIYAIVWPPKFDPDANVTIVYWPLAPTTYGYEGYQGRLIYFATIIELSVLVAFLSYFALLANYNAVGNPWYRTQLVVSWAFLILANILEAFYTAYQIMYLPNFQYPQPFVYLIAATLACMLLADYFFLRYIGLPSCCQSASVPKSMSIDRSTTHKQGESDAEKGLIAAAADDLADRDTTYAKDVGDIDDLGKKPQSEPRNIDTNSAAQDYDGSDTHLGNGGNDARFSPVGKFVAFVQAQYLMVYDSLCETAGFSYSSWMLSAVLTAALVLVFHYIRALVVVGWLQALLLDPVTFATAQITRYVTFGEQALGTLLLNALGPLSASGGTIQTVAAAVEGTASNIFGEAFVQSNNERFQEMLSYVHNQSAVAPNSSITALLLPYFQELQGVLEAAYQNESLSAGALVAYSLMNATVVAVDTAVRTYDMAETGGEWAQQVNAAFTPCKYVGFSLGLLLGVGWTLLRTMAAYKEATIRFRLRSVTAGFMTDKDQAQMERQDPLASAIGKQPIAQAFYLIGILLSTSVFQLYLVGSIVTFGLTVISTQYFWTIIVARLWPWLVAFIAIFAFNSIIMTILVGNKLISDGHRIRHPGWWVFYIMTMSFANLLVGLLVAIVRVVLMLLVTVLAIGNLSRTIFIVFPFLDLSHNSFKAMVHMDTATREFGSKRFVPGARGAAARHWFRLRRAIARHSTAQIRALVDGEAEVGCFGRVRPGKAGAQHTAVAKTAGNELDLYVATSRAAAAPDQHHVQLGQQPDMDQASPR